MADQKRKINVFSMSSQDYAGGGGQSDRTPTELTGVLAEANGFDVSFLTDNSRGRLGQGQANLLVKNLIGPVIIILVSLGILIFQINSQGYLKELSMGTPIGTLLSDMPQGLLIIGGVLLIVAIFCIFLLVTILLDMFGGTVASLEGPGWKKITTETDDDGSTTTRTYYVIADRKFSVKSKGFAALENGRNYRVYFTPRRKILVNIEALD